MDEKKRILKNKDPNEDLRNQYHPALCNAMEIGLYGDRDFLEFVQSVKMNTLPREIDFLVIRKEKEGEIKNEPGRFFRKCNIWEFKGYKGKLDIPVFYKTMSYAFEYLAANKDSDGINDMTLSFLREGRPRELMKWLENQGFIRLGSPGWIARYRREGYPDLQIVNIAHEEAPSFLKVISHKAEPKDIRDFVDYVKKLPDEEQTKARLVVELSYKINADKGGDSMGGFFETYVDPLNKVIEEKDEQINKVNKVIEEKDAEIKKKEDQINKVIEEKDAEIKKKEDQINKVAEEKDDKIEKLKAEIIRLGGNAAAF